MDLSQIPAAQPPEGVTPNFVNPPSLATLYRVIIYVFIPLMTALVVVRLGTRLRQMHKLVADDSTYTIMIPALLRSDSLLLMLDGILVFCILGAVSLVLSSALFGVDFQADH